MTLFHTLHKKKSTPESTSQNSSSSRPESISEMTLVEYASSTCSIDSLKSLTGYLRQKTRQKKEQREKRLYPQEFNGMLFLMSSLSLTSIRC